MKVFKNIIKPVAFLTLFLIVFNMLSTPLVISRDNDEYQWMAGIYGEKEDSLDAVYLGSSNCYAFWNPAIAWERSGIAVFPYVCSSQPLIAAEYLIREARKTQPDALYIINTNSLGDREKDIDDVVMHRLLDFMPLSQNKLELTDYLCDAADLSFSERLEYYFPIIRYHDNWENLTKNNFDYTINTVKGSNTRYWFFKNVYDVTDYYYIPEDCSPVTELLEDSLESLFDYLKEENVNVLFVTVPRAEKIKGEPERINTVNKMIEESGFTVLDLRDDYEEIGLDLTVDYYNVNHTNIHGSAKFTYYLSDYLIENYGFEDKRGQEDYAEWDAAAAEYAELIADRRLPVEKLWGMRDYDIPAPWIQSLTPVGEREIELVWTSAYGADGYCVYRKVEDGPWELIGDTKYTGLSDKDAVESGSYVYTIVPYCNRDGERYYGKFNYWGHIVEK